MAKFYACIKGNGSEQILGTFDDESDAIEKCVSKVKDLYSNEAEQSRLALQQRGYYCINWSCNEVYVEKR